MEAECKYRSHHLLLQHEHTTNNRSCTKRRYRSYHHLHPPVTWTHHKHCIRYKDNQFKWFNPKSSEAVTIWLKTQPKILFPIRESSEATRVGPLQSFAFVHISNLVSNSAAICLVSQSLGLSSPSLKSFMDPSIKINQHTVVLLRQNCDHVFYLKGSLLTCRNRRI